MFKKILQKFAISKTSAERLFWEREYQNYINWAEQRIPLYGHVISEKNHSDFLNAERETRAISALMSWYEEFQKKKYIVDLNLKADSFKGDKLLDIGCGPFPSALAFEQCDVYSLDPLIYKYAEIGFPLHAYDGRGRFINARSECIPVSSGFFDAVISVNAIDHVDDFEKTAREIKRVLKPNGKLAIHAHYHKKYTAEPISLNDERFYNAFSFVKGIKKVNQSKSKSGHQLMNDDECYVLWSNMHDE